MRSNTYTRAATVAASLLASGVSAGIFNAGSSSNVAVYWGQGAYQEDLSTVCSDENVDIVNIAFVNGFPKEIGDYPATNFGNACGDEYYPNPDGSKSKLLSKCPGINPGIKKCQENGKKVLLSIGGGWPTNYYLDNPAIARYFAEFLWSAFGPQDETWVANGMPRPFGDASVDGFDLDIESWIDDIEEPPEDYMFKNYDVFVKRLKTLSSGSALISAAPQCFVPDPRLAVAIKEAPFDFIFVQFYNTPICNARRAYEGLAAPADSDFTFDAWVTWLKAHSKNSNAKIYLGLPGSPAGAPYDTPSYLTPEEANDVISYYKGEHPDIFGGVMLWEFTVSQNNKLCDKPYSTWIKSILSGSYTTSTCSSSSSSSSSSVVSSTVSSNPLPTGNSTTSVPYPAGNSTTGGSPTGTGSFTTSAPYPTGNSTTGGSPTGTGSFTTSAPYPTGNSTTGGSPTGTGSSASSTLPYPTGSSSSSFVPPTAPYPTGNNSTGVYPVSTPSKSSSEVYPTDVYPTDVYPTDVYPTDVYPTDVYPTDVYPTESSSSTGYPENPASSSTPCTTSGQTYPTSSKGNPGYPEYPVTDKPSYTPNSPTETVTTYTTTYVDVCPTGLITKTATITKTVCNKCTKPTSVPEIPEGWTTTVTICTVCGPAYTTVTVTKPADKTDSYPTGPKPTGDSYVPHVPETPEEEETETLHATSTLYQVITLTKVPVPSTPSSYPETHKTSVYVPSGTGSPAGSYPTHTPEEFTGAASRLGVGMTVVAAMVAGLLAL